MTISEPRFSPHDHKSRSPHQDINVLDHDQSNILPIDLRSINDYKLTDNLLISDIDGNLHCVERNSGQLLWTLPIDEPLVKIRANSSVSDEDSSNILWFVEPYNDGCLYYFSPEYGLNKLPATIKELVLESPFSLSGDDKIYTGTRKAALYTINIHTGEIISQFGDDKCPVSGPQGSEPNKSNNKNNDYIMIGKTVYELSIYSRQNSNLVWNVTYSQWGPNNIDNDLMIQNLKSLDELYFTPFHDKSLLAINKELGTPVWITKLPSLAVNVFDIFNDVKLANNHILLPHPLKVLNNLQINQHDGTINNDLCFINKTSNSDQWFAMSFINYPTLIKSAPISNYQMSLFGIDNNVNSVKSQLNLQHLRNLNLNDDSVEGIINGIHKVHKLNSDTLYQPVSRFDNVDSIKQIGDGSSNSDLIDTASTIPNIIEGIRFSSSKSSNLPLQTQSEDYLLIESGSNQDLLPRDYFNSNTNSTTGIQSLSLIKRICEDIIVILFLLIFLMSFGKLSRYIKRFQAFIQGDTSVNFQQESSPIIIDNDINKEKLDNDDNDNNINDTSVENSSDSSTQKEKRVSIITPESGQELSDSNGNNDSDKEGATKKKRKRGSRGGKRGNKKKSQDSEDQFLDDYSDHQPSLSQDGLISTKSLVKTINNTGKIQSKKLQIENNLIISDKILGYGSHGTVVYEGTFENRPVAVKRMLLDFYDIANHEVKLLQQSDDHPNVVRYFCSQSSVSEKFLYIALELCQCSLEDLVEKPKTKLRFKKLDYLSLLYQLASGLNYLHNLKIVHRDLKPQNILIGDFKSLVKMGNHNDEARLLISDFGLCKKLDNDQSSFKATTQNAALGTSGWRAPELLLNHDLLEISPDTISSTSFNTSNGNTSNGNSNTNTSTNTNTVATKRLTKAIDIFSLGCVFFYILTGGNHPFGDRYLREGNIIRGEYDVSLLNRYNDAEELKHLIGLMIDHNPKTRPSTEMILKHPYFWPISKKLEFLIKVSDRFEVERREPPSPLLVKLESKALAVTKGNWHQKFNNDFMDNLGKYRKYHEDRLMDLLRAMRNKYHHFNDMPLELQQQMSPLPNGFYTYFNSKFPNLLLEIYFIIDETIKLEHIFQEYY